MSCKAGCLALIAIGASLGCNEPIDVFESLVPSEEPAIIGRLVEGVAPAGAVRAAILWDHYGDAGGDEETAAVADPVAGAFPADFSMEIDTPPSAAILAGSLFEEATGVPRIGYGLIVALADEGADGSPFERLVGGSADHVVVFAEDDMGPATEVDRFMGGRLAKGFHLMRVIRSPLDCQGTEDAEICYPFRLAPAPDGFATPVDVTLGAEALLHLAAP